MENWSKQRLCCFQCKLVAWIFKIKTNRSRNSNIKRISNTLFKWMSTCGRTHARCQWGETGLCIGHFHSSALAAFLFFGLNCPAVAFGHFSLFLVEFVLLFMLYFFLERRCATAFKICTAFDILINHASRRMSHSQSVGLGRGGVECWKKVSLIVSWTSSKRSEKQSNICWAKVQGANGSRRKRQTATTGNRTENEKMKKKRITRICRMSNTLFHLYYWRMF